MVIIGNYKVNYDTATTTVNKSMSFDLLFSIKGWPKKNLTNFSATYESRIKVLHIFQ